MRGGRPHMALIFVVIVIGLVAYGLWRKRKVHRDWADSPAKGPKGPSAP